MKEQPQSGTSIEFGPFSFDKALGKLSKHGTLIRLRGMPLKILHHLVERPGETVSRGELQNLLWNGTAFGDFEQGLNSAVNVVRRTLSDSADQPRFIETVPGNGYRFIAPVRSEAAVRETLPSGTALVPDTVTLDSDSRGAVANHEVENVCAILETPEGPKATPRRFPWVIAAVL